MDVLMPPKKPLAIVFNSLGLTEVPAANQEVVTTAPVRCRFPVSGPCGSQCDRDAVGLVEFCFVCMEVRCYHPYSEKVARFSCDKHIQSCEKAGATVHRTFRFVF